MAPAKSTHDGFGGPRRGHLHGALRSLPLVALLGLGCESAGDDEGETGTAEGRFETALLECEAPAECGTISYQSYAPPNPPSLPSTATLQCVIDRLDARMPATLIVSSGCEGSCSGDIYLLRSDGTALRQGWYDDFGSEGGVTLPGGSVVQVSDWSQYGTICDVVPAGSCTPETCPRPSDWFINCRDTSETSCEA